MENIPKMFDKKPTLNQKSNSLTIYSLLKKAAVVQELILAFICSTLQL